MKIIVVLFFALFASTSFAQPAISVVPDTLDFGNVPPQQFLQDTLIVLNRGTDTLVILGVETSCGCTEATPQSSKVPFMGNAVVRVSVNITNRQGMFIQWVRLKTNDPKTPVIEIPIIANIGTINAEHKRSQ